MEKRVSAGLVVAVCVVALWQARPSFAQHRWPGPAATHGFSHGHRPGSPFFSVGFPRGPYFGPYVFSPWFSSGPWWYQPYGYRYYLGAVGVQVRIQVQPKSAEVYVDGYLAGTVDEFDGMLQSLLVAPGRHEITLYQEGYKSIVRRMYLSIRSSYTIKGVMEKLAPGDPNEPRPMPVAQPETALARPGKSRAPAPAAHAVRPDAGATASTDSRFGQVAIRVQPVDAEITIDGEIWKGPQGAERLLVNLAAGRHRIEVRKEGFESFVTATEIKKGEVTVLNVSLSKQ